MIADHGSVCNDIVAISWGSTKDGEQGACYCCDYTSVQYTQNPEFALITYVLK